MLGRPVNAVLSPPQAGRFASLAGVDLDGLVLNVTGWNKLVLLDSDRVFLFPRAAAGVEWSSGNSPLTGPWPQRS